MPAWITAHCCDTCRHQAVQYYQSPAVGVLYQANHTNLHLRMLVQIYTESYTIITGCEALDILDMEKEGKAGKAESDGLLRMRFKTEIQCEGQNVRYVHFIHFRLIFPVSRSSMTS